MGRARRRKQVNSDACYALCPRCKKRRGRYDRVEYQFGVVKAKCRNCGTEFYFWKGKNYVIPDDVEDLQLVIDAHRADLENEDGS